jgi:hypothetical protein
VDESLVQVLRGVHPALHGGLSREARRQACSLLSGICPMSASLLPDTQEQAVASSCIKKKRNQTPLYANLDGQINLALPGWAR